MFSSEEFKKSLSIMGFHEVPTLADLKAKYKELILLYHPDKS